MTLVAERYPKTQPNDIGPLMHKKMAIQSRESNSRLSQKASCRDFQTSVAEPSTTPQQSVQHNTPFPGKLYHFYGGRILVWIQ